MNQAFDEAFGRRIRTLREQKGLTQEALAARMQVLGCDVTRGALAKIETALRHVYPDEIAALAAALGVSPNELFRIDCNSK